MRHGKALPAALAVALALAAAPASARATPALSWSAPAGFDHGKAPQAISCPSESLCVGVDGEGDALSTSSPTAPSPFWNTTAIDPGGRPLTGVSCAPGGLCVAVDAHGNALVNHQPASSWSPTSIDGAALTGVSCPSASLCVAVDEVGDALTSTNPTAGAWTLTEIDSGHHLEGVSCPSQSLCVAVDDAGDVLASIDPAAGAWRTQRVDFGGLRGVSCSAAGPCVAVDGAGDALSSADPGAVTATWGLTPIDAVALTSISCAASGVCVAVDARGTALASDDPASALPAWSESSIDPEALAGISCLAGGFCMALDTAGNWLSARAPAPRVTTGAPSEVTSSSAALAGRVDPNDAQLGACSFEYSIGGAGGAYTQSVPCSALPVASGGEQGVSAQIGELTPNTTYHYRVLASSPAGARAGTDEVFTTAVSSQVALVHPHPSLTGTPAPGQRLTCHANIPAEASAQLSYVWLRDQIPIPGSATSTYTIKFQDGGHHLQCQVSATDGGGTATANSGFATVPVGGAPASVGETVIGRAALRSRRIDVPVTCSPQASGGCQIALRLSAVETLSAGHVLAVAARAPGRAHTSAAVQQRTLTLASARVHVAAGAHTTLAGALSATGRRLLASIRPFSAYLYVSGTVIGVIEAQLARELIAVGTSSVGARGARAESTRARGARADVHPSATTAASVLAATPYMGWDTYFALGGNYSEATILSEASRLISLGLEKRGYRYVWLDVGWWHGTRAANGQITVSASQWPHGLAWLTRTLHAAGLLVGLYTDAGPDGCGGAGQGSYGHYQQDVNTFASWGFDAVKVDFCGGAEHQLNPAAAYSAFHAAIAANSSGRPMLLSICNFLQPEQYAEGAPPLDESAFASYTFGPTVGNSWRTDTDVGLPHNVPFADVLRNMDADAAAPQAAGPGHWNDPDYLAPDQGMSATQFATQLSMWAMLAAPLMVSDDLRKISSASLAALQDSEVTAIDQDPGAVQGTLLSSSTNRQVWVKPLIGGARAVALLNRGSSATRIATSASAVGLPAASSYGVRNVWTHTTSSTGGSIVAEVPGDGTVLLRVSPR
jgi:Alpha galactosidase A/Alpha galactosidase C-terminal beta sandwich domain